MPHGQNADTVTKNLGRVVAEIRRDLGWTQKDAADAMGVPPQRWSSIELGKTNLTLSVVTDIANVLGVEVATLFAGPKGSPKKAGIGRPPRSK